MAVKPVTGKKAPSSSTSGTTGGRTGRTRSRGSRTPQRKGKADPDATSMTAYSAGKNKSKSQVGTRTIPKHIQEQRMRRQLRRDVKVGNFSAVNFNPKYAKQMKKRRNVVQFRCLPSLDVYTISKNKAIQRSRHVGNVICGLRKAYAYKSVERKYQVQENEYRVFIEGAEVTSYVEGALSWTVESTGGLNNCRFTLNNTQDAFIITPKNVCAGPYNPNSWRVPWTKDRKGSYYVYSASNRTSWRVDEVAKFLIYKRKFESVHPKRAGEDFKQIDSYTGMWLYPLNPFSCIFNKHDAVRVFVRLPHVPSSGRSGYSEGFDLWMPAFTGFIKDYSWNDSPIEGKRTVAVTCYDYRALLDRMRVRVYPAGNKTGGDADKPTDKKGAKGKDAHPTDKSDASKNSKYYLAPAIKIGKEYETLLGNRKSFRAFRALYKDIAPNSWEYAQKAFFAFDTIDEVHVLYMTFLLKGGPKNKGACAPPGRDKPDFRGGQFSRSGRDVGNTNSSRCMTRTVRVADDLLRPIAAQISQQTGRVLQKMALIYDLVGTAYQLYVSNTYRKPTTRKTIRATSVALKDMGNSRRKGEKSDKSGKSRSAVGRLTAAQEFIQKNRTKFITAATTYVKSASLANRPIPLVSKLSNKALIVTYRQRQKEYEKSIGALNTMRSLEAQVESILLKSNNPIFNKENKPTTVTTPASANLLRAQQKGIDSVIKQLREQYKKAKTDHERGLIAGEIERFKKQKKDLKQMGGATVQRDDKSYRAKLGLTEFGITEKLMQIVRLDTQLRSTGFAAAGVQKAAEEKLKNLKLADSLTKKGLDASSAATQLVQQWGATYSAAVNIANTLATQAHTDANKYINDTTVAGGTPKGLAPILRYLEKVRNTYYRKLPQGYEGKRALSSLKGVRTRIREMTVGGKKAQQAHTVGEAIVKYASFEKKHAGIFADLVTRLDNAQSHPLRQKSFAEAVEYLCCEQQRIIRGVVGPDRGGSGNKSRTGIYSYEKDKGILEDWNQLVLFGAVQRPLSYNEVTLIGRGTVSDLREDFSPYNVFYHLMLPGGGTSVSTIVQAHTGKHGINSTTINYETRKKLLDEICSVLDYQYWVSGMGDLIFEFPHYNIMPEDFGITFKDAYKLRTDWIDATISEESQDIPTAWVITGLDSDKIVAAATGGVAATNHFKKIVITAPILARRLGVRVENVNLTIPGIGSPTEVGNDKMQALDQLQQYGYFHIQRQLGRAHSMQVRMPFRPYIVPNRPLYLVHRQRIGLVQSVTHTMNGPNGDCTTSCNTHYTRWTFRDGTWRHLAGGPKMPIDYTSFFTGLPPGKFPNADPTGYSVTSPKEGTGLAGPGATPRASSSVGCSGELRTRLLEASAFSSSVAAQWGAAYAPNLSGTPSWSKDLASSDYRLSGLRMARTGGSGTRVNTDRFVGKPLKYVYDAWKYVSTKQNGFESFGYLRRGHWPQYAVKQTKRNARKMSSYNWDSYHKGWDLPAGVGQLAKAPVDIYKAEASLAVGAWQGGGYVYGFLNVRGKAVKKNGKTTIKLFMGKAWRFQVRNAVPFKVKGQKNYFIKIYATQYLLWKALAGDKKGSRITLSSRSTGGLSLTAYGNVKVPGLNTGTGGYMKAKMSYRHLHTLHVKDGKFIGSELKSNSNPNEPLVNAGEVIAICGSTATNNSHLHFELEIQPGAAKTPAAQQQVRVALAANKAFIDATLMARARFYKWTNPSIPTGDAADMNAPANKYWQEKAFLFKKKRGSTVTVGDVVKLFQSRNLYKKFVPDDQNTGTWVVVNPAHYFKPHELLGPYTGSFNSNQKKIRFGAYRAKLEALESLVGKATEEAKTSWCAGTSGWLKNNAGLIQSKCFQHVQKVAVNWSKKAQTKAYARCVSRSNRMLKFSSKIDSYLSKGKIDVAVHKIQKSSYVSKKAMRNFDAVVQKANKQISYKALSQGNYPDLKTMQ